MANATTIERYPNCAGLVLQPKDAVEPRTARVEELLRQNHPPLDVELSALRKVAEDTRSALEDLDSKIVQARELLENLLAAREQAQSRLEDTKSLLHPMRSIPDELLAEIFGHCILPERFVEDPDSLDPREAPWLLTRVSRRWRNLAVNLPRLWTYLLLDFDKHEGHISNHQCAYKVCLFTERSRGLPMTVCLNSDISIKDHPVLPVFEASIPRWWDLEVALPRASLQLLSGNNFLMLQTLSLRELDQNEWHLNLDVFKSTSAPVLRHLEVHEDMPWRALEHVTFPWSQVASIMSFPAFDPDGLNRLRTTADLEELDVLAGSEASTPIRDVISLSKLHRLTITESQVAAGRSKEFFSALEVPALSELILDYHNESVLHFPVSPLPLGNLIKLDITCGMNSHEENTQFILDFLALTHHVESLRLHDPNLTAAFCDGLNLDKVQDGVPARLPCLQSLDIGRCGFAPKLNSDIDGLFEMLYSRLPVGMAEEKQGEEETGNATGSCNGGIGKSAAADKTSALEYDSRSRSDSEEQRRYLKKVQIPRRLYVKMRTEWPDTFLGLTSQAELECPVTMRDIKS